MVLDLDKLIERCQKEWLEHPLFWPVFFNCVWLKQSKEFRLKESFKVFQLLRVPGVDLNNARFKKYAEMFYVDAQAYPHTFPNAINREGPQKWEVTVFGAVPLAIIDLHENHGLTSISKKKLRELIHDWQRRTNRPVTIFSNQWSLAFKQPEIIALLEGLSFSLTR
jgi:hypothetical protein